MFQWDDQHAGGPALLRACGLTAEQAAEQLATLPRTEQASDEEVIEPLEATSGRWRAGSGSTSPPAVGGDPPPVKDVLVDEGLWQQGVRFGFNFNQEKTRYWVIIHPGDSGLTHRQVLDHLLQHHLAVLPALRRWRRGRGRSRSSTRSSSCYAGSMREWGGGP